MKRKIDTALTWLCRLLVGTTFVLSGFTKAVDPWGTFYKLGDYAAAVGMTFPSELLTAAAYALAAFEFALGVMLLTGSFRRFAPIATGAVMAVMLPLTLWIAIANPVADCGCFGDAFKLSNWATFFKNIILSAATFWLIWRWHNRRAHWIITPALQWIGLTLTAFFIVTIAARGYNVQPVFDFRPYKVGTPLFAEGTAEETTYSFVYEKDGKRREFSEDEEMPDENDGWKFIERKEITNSVKPAANTDAEPLHLWDSTGTEDVTDSAISDDDRQILLILIPSMSEVSAASTWRINALKEWCDAHDVLAMAVVAGDERQIADWEDLSMADYPIYTAEDTTIKEIARGNPAVVFVKDGKIVWKSTLSALDDNLFEDPQKEGDIETFVSQSPTLLRSVTAVYLCAMGVLAMLSFMPKVSLFRRRKESQSETETIESQIDEREA